MFCNDKSIKKNLKFIIRNYYKFSFSKSGLNPVKSLVRFAPDDKSGLKHASGNVRMAFTDESGTPQVAQKNNYYPCLLSHLSKSGTQAFGLLMTERTNTATNKNPYLYNGKLKQSGNPAPAAGEMFTGEFYNWYDYGARMYDPQLGRWHSLDNLSEKYYSTSPYAYCGNNPIMRIDVDGNVWTPAGQAWVNALYDEMTRQTISQQNKINKTQAKIDAGGHSQKKLDRLNNRLANQRQTLSTMNTEFAQVRTELEAMGASAQVYNVVEDASLNAPRTAGEANGTATGKTVYNTQTGAVDIRIPTLDNQLSFFAHEAKHGYQFEMGETSIKLWDANGEQNARGMLGVDLLLYDWSDEQAAYSRGAFFGGKRTPSPYAGVPQGPVDFRTHPQNNILTGGNAQLIRTTAQQYRMAIRVPVNDVRTTFW